MAASWLLQALYTSLLGGALQGKSKTDDVYVLANTTSGSIRGKVTFTPNVPVARFLGVPYAKPPVGSLRFAAPQDPDPWANVLDTFEFGHICIQNIVPGYEYRYTSKNVTRSEDCLSLNIYVPTNRSSSQPLPVMFWIHGGGYTIGFGADDDGTYLAQNNVIVVTINYRLDVFGFMSTEDDLMPGNYGMMDQVAALKWVNKNIAAFGGDPNMITIFGESAGSSSVSLLTMSPLSKGLFRRAIMESGSALSPWASQNPGNAVSAKTFARLISVGVNCFDLDDVSKLLPCLRAVDAGALQNVTKAVSLALNGAGAMAPRVETTFNFLPDSPINLLSSGQIHHVDTLRGYNSDELGLWFNFNLLPTSESGIIPALGSFIKMFTELDKSDLMQEMFQRYIKNDTDSLTKLIAAFDASNDVGFIAPMVTELNLAAKHKVYENHFLYKFDYRSSQSKKPQWMNAVHTAEVPFVFDVHAYPTLSKYASADDLAVSKQMVERWTNFAKTGHPSAGGGAVWAPYSPGAPFQMIIKKTSEQKLWQRQDALDLYLTVLQKMSGWVPPSDNIVG